MSAFVAIGGCKKKEKEGGDASSDAGASAAEPSFKANREVTALLKSISEGCTVSVDSPSVYSCKNKEDSALSDFIRKSRPKDLYETYASLLSSTDAKMRAIAIYEANSSLFTLDNDLRKANATKPVATAFLDAYAKDDGYAVHFAEPAVALGFLAGLKDRVFKVTESVHTDAKKKGYRKFLQYGGMEVFPKVQQAAKEKDLAYAALEAPYYLSDWTEAEKGPVCPWAKGYLADASSSVAAEAGRVMIKCKSPYIEALLDEGEKRLAAKTLEEPFAGMLGQVCSSFAMGAEIETNPLCKRNFVFLEKMVNDPSLKPDVRASALYNIFSQRRNKESLAVMRKYQRSKVPEIAKRAKDAIDQLATQYKIK